MKKFNKLVEEAYSVIHQPLNENNLNDIDVSEDLNDIMINLKKDLQLLKDEFNITVVSAKGYIRNPESIGEIKLSNKDKLSWDQFNDTGGAGNSQDREIIKFNNKTFDGEIIDMIYMYKRFKMGVLK